MTKSDATEEQSGLFGPVEAPEPPRLGEADPRLLEPLTAREKEMLLMEQKVWRYAGAKESAIRDRWDISATRYYQLQNQIIDKEAALAWDPITVKRLRRQRTARQRTRSARRLAVEL
jgi:hypothetical protein